MKEIVNGLLNMIEEEAKISNIGSKRNWLIRVEERSGKNRIVYAGAFGEGKRRGWLSPVNVTYIAEHNVRWFMFTYKADYMKALNTLKDNEFIG